LAVQWTLQHLYRPGDVLHLVHVIPEEKLVVPITPVRAPFATDSYDELQETMVSSTPPGQKPAGACSCYTDMHRYQVMQGLERNRDHINLSEHTPVQ
jgi:hypothetical protein